MATHAQILASNPNASTWLSANAGSGKTRVLTDRVARLLLEGTSPENILCLTYTKAAASEMQNRLFKRLGKWSMQDDKALKKSLAEIGLEKGLDKQKFKQARTLFARAIEVPGSLKIQTIHSFCSSLLRRFPLEAGVSHNFTEIDEPTTQNLCMEILEKIAADKLDSAILNKISKFSSDVNLGDLLNDILNNRTILSHYKNRSEIYSEFGLTDNKSLEQYLKTHFTSDDLKIVETLKKMMKSSGARDQTTAKKLSSIEGLDLNFIKILENVFLYKSSTKKPDYSAKIDDFASKSVRTKLSSSQKVLLNGLAKKTELFRQIR